jgi:ribosomal-protein-alanine N-acetyltransferase
MSATDLGRVLEIAAGSQHAPQWPASVYLAAIDPEHRPRRIALAAVDPETDVAQGFVIASLVPPEAELETIAVAAEAQRQNIGTRLLRALVGELPKDQATELGLEVRASNSAAIGFYRAEGFAEVGRRLRYYADPEEDAILMRIQLSGLSIQAEERGRPSSQD